MTELATMNCPDCGGEVAVRSAMQKYCVTCSEARHLVRAKRSVVRDTSKSQVIARGKENSRFAVRRSLVWAPPPVHHEWLVSFKVPFTQAASKNHVWSLGSGTGHVFKRRESRAFQDLVALKAREATRGIKIVQNKVWIDIFVQKANHKGDAINVVDVLCDGLKLGLGIDDRWFCLDGVDWEIAKNDPQIYVSISQREDFDVQPCSHCGRVLPLGEFGRKATARMGVDRSCRECKNSTRKRRAPADGEWQAIGDVASSLVKGLA